MNQNEIYQKVTDTIIKLLETHLEDWKRPWIAFGQDQDYARNAESGSYYRGINQFLLSSMLINKSYIKNQWLTFKQALDLGGNIRRGEKSCPVIFYKTGFIDSEKRYYSEKTIQGMSNEAREAKGLHKIPILKLYHVFNVAQTEGLEPSFYEAFPVEPLSDFEKDERAEALLLACGADIVITESNRAYYDPTSDKIRLPLREQFNGTGEFYATALHELGHWSGAETRLNRQFGKEFGDTAYGREELVAELSSAFCCASLGFSKVITQNAAYIKSWLGILKEDTRAIVRASAQAQAAADYIFEKALENEVWG